MQETSKQIFLDKHCKNVENNIAMVDEIFRLQDEKGLAEDEQIYIPKSTNNNIVFSSESKENAMTKSKEISSCESKKTTGINPLNFVRFLESIGIKFVVGVPDSLINNFIECLPKANQINNTLYHHIAANEGTALAIASGYQVGSLAKDPNANPPIIYLQNSGLGNLINVLLSLTHKDVYAIPAVIIVGWRGESSLYQKHDEPQHRVQGLYMLDMLKAMGMDTYILPQDSDLNAEQVMFEAIKKCKEVQQPVFVVVKSNTFSLPDKKIVSEESNMLERELEKIVSNDSNKMQIALKKEEILDIAKINHEIITRRDALEVIHHSTLNWKARIGTTGKLSRELYEITTKDGTKCKDFLMVGSMGHVLSFTAGICYTGLKGNILCIDGDGSLIMHTGSMITVNSLPPGSRLLHLTLNNKLHESVGTQPTGTSYPQVSLSGIASNMGYQKVKTVTSKEEVQKFIKEFEEMPISETNALYWFLEWVISPSSSSSKELSRPKELPVERKQTFIKHLSNNI
jgi:phosphonopyruvate decarboxylase